MELSVTQLYNIDNICVKSIFFPDHDVPVFIKIKTHYIDFLVLQNLQRLSKSDYSEKCNSSKLWCVY